MIKKKNMYSRPRKPFESVRIKEENEIRKKYGLKNKREIWKAIAKVDYFRKRAMALTNSPMEEQEVLFNKLRYLGLQITNTADVLGLTVEHILDRRLPTIVAQNGIANTVNHARQMVVHKRILINGSVVNIPSYLVSVPEEKEIKIKEKVKKPKEEVKEKSQETEESAESEEGQEIKDTAEKNQAEESTTEKVKEKTEEASK